MRCRLATTVILVFIVASVAQAQTTAGGSIRGYVKDQQGGVLPGVTLTATSPNVAGARTAVSDAGGFYRLLDVPPGDYTVTADLQGFAKLVRENISVRAGLEPRCRHRDDTGADDGDGGGQGGDALDRVGDCRASRQHQR
jgi:hypothetical protein